MSTPLPIFEKLDITPLEPFGLLVRPRDPEVSVVDIPPTVLARWAGQGRVLVLRGFPSLDKDSFLRFAQTWGPLLEWPFGYVLDLEVHENPDNYLFTPGAVPFHWDGAFAAQVPSYMFFHCRQAPRAGSGGATTFCDTTRVIEQAPAEVLAGWEAAEIAYTTEKVAHYGGAVTTPLTSRHPITGAPVLRFAEPLDPAEYKNPVFVEIAGLSPTAQDELIADLQRRLYAADALYAHEWADDDFVLVDNHAVLHGRQAFAANSPRHLQRIHIL
jgi:alpha-ketoglutarate-dependent taurine dioxygenase